MDTSRLATLSLSQLRAYYRQEASAVTEESIHVLEQDPRKGVQALGKSLRARKEKQQQEQQRLAYLRQQEELLWATGYLYIAGVDEVGMGCLAGPVIAAAVVLPPHISIPGIDDSKALSPTQRETLAQEIRRTAPVIGIGMVTPSDIDRLNIHRAGLQAMQLAIASLTPQPEYVLIDGRFTLPLGIPQQALIRGDQQSYSIAAASIIAKVYRDQVMVQYHDQYPVYGFARHKGYGTPEHLAALRTYGPCPIHRRSYRPVETANLFSD